MKLSTNVRMSSALSCHTPGLRVSGKGVRVLILLPRHEKDGLVRAVFFLAVQTTSVTSNSTKRRARTLSLGWGKGKREGGRMHYGEQRQKVRLV